MIRFPAYAVIAVVLLRLLCGWHFYNEGVKKLDPSFSSAGFLRGAKGPFAPMFKEMASGPYGAYKLLAVPVETGSRPADEQAAINKWVSDCLKIPAQREKIERANAKARKEGKATKPLPELPTELDPAVPGAAWVKAVGDGWREGLARMGRRSGENDAEILDEKLRDLVYYVTSEYDGVEEFQHEVWRLEKLKKAAGKNPAPFEWERIADKEREVWSTMRPWVSEMQLVEASLVADLADANDSLDEDGVAEAMQERSTLAMADKAVTVVVLGAGILVFLGLFTRVAAVAAAGFLVSLIMTQPPGVVGADLGAFFTWSIEMGAFLVLAAVGAGRWAGLDGLLEPFWKSFGVFMQNQREQRQELAKSIGA